MSIFYKLPVKEIRRETVDSVSVSFEIPDHLKQEFQFIAGQYITLQIELQGSLLRRAYSICSSPSSGELRIAIKEVDKGRFSHYANREMKVGSTLEVAAPEAGFVSAVARFATVRQSAARNKRGFMFLVIPFDSIKAVSSSCFPAADKIGRKRHREKKRDVFLFKFKLLSEYG